MKVSELNSVEYNPYYKRYIDLVAEISLSEVLSNGLSDTLAFFENLPTPKWTYRYAEDKWTPKDILLHMIDTERVFSYRALYFSRAENAELIGFDENIFAANANANQRNSEDLLKEYHAVRTATINLFESFDSKMLLQAGIANKNKMSVRAAGFIIGGHEIHHRNIIKERYLL